MEIKFNIGCLGWFAFDQKIDFNLNDLRHYLGIGRNDKVIETQERIRLIANNFTGRWCFTERHNFVRILIEDAADAVLYKLMAG